MAFAQRPGAPLVADLQSRRYAHQVGRLPAIGGLVTGNNWLDRTTKTLKNTTTLNVTMLENRLRLSGRLLVPHQGLHRD